MFSFMNRPSMLGLALSLPLLVSAAGCLGPEEEVADGQPVEPTGELEAKVWTGWTSEEMPPLECTSGRLVSGVECNGSNCDNVRLDCYPVSGTFGYGSWSTYFSEESPNTRYCGTNAWMTGIACRGSYCDMLSIECTELTGRTVGSCAWSGYFSEEHGPFQAPAGHYIRGIECNGAYCDNKRYYYCRLQ